MTFTPGFILFASKAPILLYSKLQNMVIEISTFGSEFCAMKMVIYMIEGLCKLWMMGVPLIGSTLVFCDNESVIRNLTAPQLSLKKWHNAIVYHHAREAQVVKII